MNATSDEDSMGNASMVQMGTVRVTDKGEVTLEMDFQSMKFAGMTGYLYKMKKVDMDTVEYNKYNYPKLVSEEIINPDLIERQPVLCRGLCSGYGKYR